MSNDSEEIHHESVENIIVDDSADMKPFFHDPAGFVSNVNWSAKTAENCLKLRIKTFQCSHKKILNLYCQTFAARKKAQKEKAVKAERFFSHGK